MNKLNLSLRPNLLIGLLLGVWIFLLAFIIRPLDDGTLNLKAWILMSINFSLGAFTCYAILTIIQKKVYQKMSGWSLVLEIFSIIFFHLLYLAFSYLFYKHIIGGGYNFYQFLTIIFIKVALIMLTPVIVLARWFLIKLIPLKEVVLSIKGENKLDILKIKKADLVCISNAQNYVEIYFIQDEKLTSKLIRSTLKKIQEDLDFLVKVHRSHLINPSHFKSWKNNNTISLTQIELPVSKSYKSNLLSL